MALQAITVVPGEGIYTAHYASELKDKNQFYRYLLLAHIPAIPKTTFEPLPPLRTPMLANDQKPLLIGVMGVTGVGKSHFIKSLTGDTGVIVSKGSKSCTKIVRKCAPIQVDGYAVELVDTPGFGDTVMTDPEILKLIAQWLKDSYDDDRKLHGIVYLHSIMTTRMDGEGVKSLNIFGNICGPNYLANTVLVTTKWDRCKDAEDLEEAEDREEEMKKDFWASFFDSGVMYEKSDNTKATFERILSRIVCQPVNEPELQKDVGEGKDLKDTAAGSGLQTEVTELLAKQQAAFDELARQTAERNDALKEQLAKSIAQSRKDLQELNSSFEKKSNEKELRTIRGRLESWSTTFTKNMNQQPTITRRDQFADLVNEITVIKAALTRLGNCGIEGFGAVGKEVDDGMMKAKSMSDEENKRVKSAEESLDRLKSEHGKWNTEYIALVKTPAASATITSFEALEARLLAIEESVASYDEKGMRMEARGLAKLVKDSKAKIARTLSIERAKIAETLLSEKAKIAETLSIERARRAREDLFKSLEREYNECALKYDKRHIPLSAAGLEVLEGVLEQLSKLQGGLRGLEGKEVYGEKALGTKVNNLKSTLVRMVRSESDRLREISVTLMIQRREQEAQFRSLEREYNECKLKYDKHNIPLSAAGLVVLEGVLQQLSGLQGGLRGLEGKEVDGTKELGTKVNNLKSTLTSMVRSERDRLREIAVTLMGERRKQEAQFRSLEGEYNEWKLKYDKRNNPGTAEGLVVLKELLEELLQLRGGLRGLEGIDIPRKRELVTNVKKVKSTLSTLVRSESDRLRKIAESLVIERERRAHEAQFTSLEDKYEECRIMYDGRTIPGTPKGLVTLEELWVKQCQIQEGLRGLEGKNIDGKRELVTNVKKLKSTLSTLVGCEKDRLREGAREMQACRARFTAWMADYEIMTDRLYHISHSCTIREVLHRIWEDMNKHVANGIPDLGLEALIKDGFYNFGQKVLWAPYAEWDLFTQMTRVPE